MLKFRQLIRPGQRGKDVSAVKDAMLRMGVKGSGALGKTNKAGPRFVECLKRVQVQHGQKADGIYGPNAHKIISPHFSAWDRLRYRTAKIRQVEIPKVTDLSAQAAARKLLEFNAQGKYHADNPGDLRDITATAAGKPVWSQSGRYVHIDKRILEALVLLIEKGFRIGTFAICSDHHYDGPHGHAGGLAADISSVNGVSVETHSDAARDATLKLAKVIHSEMPAGLHAWQEICDGYGNMHYEPISNETIPNVAFYGYTTMSEHRNHIHLGYYSN